METVPCNLCGADAADPRFTLPDLLLEREDVVATLVQCRQCGLVYQNPRPALAEMGAHYPPEYEPYATNAGGKQASWLLRRAIEYGIRKRCRFVTRHKKEGGRLLDVGCATGVFLRGMQRTPGNWELHGVEISEHAARIARRHSGLHVHLGTLEEAAFPDAYFDAVTMWDVLEHLHNPAASLREIERILKPDGVIVIRVPNAASWGARLFGPYWAGLDAPRHLYLFSPRTLSRLLQRTGFRVVHQTSGSGSYLTFLLSLRFWMVARRVRRSVRQGVLNALYHPVMRLLTVPLFYMEGLFLRGPLLVTTATKTNSHRG